MAFPVFLKNGERVKVNDHVYCSPSWAARDGTPYCVGRIMEFLGPEGTSHESNAKLYHKTRVRLAWYYRPHDVSDRPVADSRLLLAAIFSEVCDINQLRAKCHVIHRDKITDLAGWKKRPDRFYFNRLFDPYFKREFEVIQATDVRNLPDRIRESLTSRYEYVVAEKEVIPDLTDAIRLCDTCSEWCPSLETVRCDRCKKFFHMGCVQPPLLAKPSRGYGWTCAPCSRRHEEEVDSHEVRHATPVMVKPKSNAPAPRGRGRPRKDRTLAEKEENFPIKYWNGWPFRYFGQYTVAEDTLDPDDLIFPRSAIRIGAKYQANVPFTPGIDVTASGAAERGGEATVEVLSSVHGMTADQLAEMEAHIDNFPESPETGVDWLTEVIRRFSDAFLNGLPLPTVNMKSLTRLEKWKKQETRYTDRPWTVEELVLFESAILAERKKGELRAVKDKIVTRSMPEVVRFYGHWKNLQLREENYIRQLGTPPLPEWRRWDSMLEAADGQYVGPADDDESIADQPPEADSICGACRTRDSKVWWKAPRGLTTDILCDTCGTNWRKYADLNVRPLREESLPSGKAKPSEKREGSPLIGSSVKRARTSVSTQSPPPPHPHPAAAQIRCLVCHSDGPLGKVLKCRQCHFRVHAGSCGVIADSASLESWRCELCENEETLEASMNSDCLLCPRLPKEAKKQAPTYQHNSFLHARKPTEGQGWAHVLCSVFISELSFTDSSRLRLVEGISTIPHHRWSTPCALCGEAGGAVIRCSDCLKEYHASCAWNHGYKFGFEIQPVKSSRRDTTAVTTFKGETGCMSPVVCCRQHDTRRHIYGICETNEVGETALQVYCQIYKQAPVGQAHGLLRKARRLDQVLNTRGDTSLPFNPDNTSRSQSVPDPRCYQCHTIYSPLFYRLPPSIGSFMAQDIPNAWLCHKCHFQSRETVKNSNTSGIRIAK